MTIWHKRDVSAIAKYRFEVSDLHPADWLQQEGATREVREEGVLRITPTLPPLTERHVSSSEFYVVIPSVDLGSEIRLRAGAPWVCRP